MTTRLLSMVGFKGRTSHHREVAMVDWYTLREAMAVAAVQEGGSGAAELLLMNGKTIGVSLVTDTRESALAAAQAAREQGMLRLELLPRGQLFQLEVRTL